jgi:hypothetical protein
MTTFDVLEHGEQHNAELLIAGEQRNGGLLVGAEQHGAGLLGDEASEYDLLTGGQQREERELYQPS